MIIWFVSICLIYIQANISNFSNESLKCMQQMETIKCPYFNIYEGSLSVFFNKCWLIQKTRLLIKVETLFKQVVWFVCIWFAFCFSNCETVRTHMELSMYKLPSILKQFVMLTIEEVIRKNLIFTCGLRVL